MSKSMIRRLLPWMVFAIYWPFLFFLTHAPKLPPVQVWGKDKTMHFIAYGVLTGLFWLAKFGRVRPRLRQKRVYKVVLLFALYGVLDELTQKFVGRQYEVWDWVADMAGCLFALLMLYIIRRWVYGLIVYWVGLFVVRHWPGDVPVISGLPFGLDQYGVVYLMAGYLGLTLIWWRTIAKEGKFVFSARIFWLTLLVLSCCAVFDEVLAEMMNKGYDGMHLAASLAGIGLGVVVALCFAKHQEVMDAHAYQGERYLQN